MKRWIVWAAMVAAGCVFGVTGGEQWKGAKVAFLGDSITDPNTLGAGTPTFVGYLKETLEIEPSVYAVSGHHWTHLMGQIDRLEQSGTEPDAVIIFCGTNDYAANAPLGEWFTLELGKATRFGAITSPSIKRTLCLDMKTFRGRINAVLLRLRKRYPEAQVVILTPIHRAFFQCSPTNIQPDENYPNSLGLFLEDYVQVLREASDRWSVPVIDLYARSGLSPMVEEQGRFFRNGKTDRLHPNAKGHRQMGKLIALELRNLPANLK
ncbi:MAG: SGNH/GDSL hydrolase family protein [Kiritimatiellia bacterium]